MTDSEIVCLGAGYCVGLCDFIQARRFRLDEVISLGQHLFHDLGLVFGIPSSSN